MSVILLASIAFLPLRLIERLNTDDFTDEMLRRRESYFHGVITLWQVDSLEGGTGNRSGFLRTLTTGFERRYNGLYVDVISISPQMANFFLSNKQKMPDMISFGMGVALKKEELTSLTVNTDVLRPEVVRFAEAVPWCMGAYFMIGDVDRTQWGIDGKITGKKKKQTIYSVGISEKSGYVPTKALLKTLTEPFDFSQETALICQSPSENFYAYCHSRTVKRILGTQRDLYRLSQAQENEGSAELITAYDDLFQFVGVLPCENEQKATAMNRFAEYLLETDVQSRLGEIGMFPVIGEATPEYTLGSMDSAWESLRKGEVLCESYLFCEDQAREEYENALNLLISSKKD